MDHVGGDACITEVRDSEKRVLYMVKSPANQEVVHYVTDEFCTCNEWYVSFESLPLELTSYHAYPSMSC